jgi:chromosome segregation ATPase
MDKTPLSSSLRSILSVLEDETTDDITKWRNFCFRQLTRLRFSEFHHFQVGLQFQQTSTRLTEEISRISADLAELKETQATLRTTLAAATDLEKLISAKFQRFNAADASENLIQMQLDRAPQTFSDIFESHRETRIKDLDRLFARISKKVALVSAAVDRIETKLQTLIRLLQKRKDEIRQTDAMRDRLRSEISQLKETFSQIQTPVLPPEVTAISAQFENSAEAAKKLLAIERSIAELEASIARVQLDNRPSQCAALEDLIERQKNAQRELLQSVMDKYRTDGLEMEIEQARTDVEEAQKALRQVQESTEAKCCQISKEAAAQSSELEDKIAQNESAIQRLREEIAELGGQLPTPSRAARVTAETMTVFRDPLFF